MYCQYCGQQLPFRYNLTNAGPAHLCTGVLTASDTPTKKTWWRADNGHRYWVAITEEDVMEIREISDDYDNKKYYNHNYFQTKQDAVLHGTFVKSTMEAMVCDGKYTILADGKVEFDQKYPASLRFDSDSEAKSFVRLRKEYIAMLRRHFR